MSRFEGRVDEMDETSWGSTLKFVLTLIVATVIVAVAVSVLSAPLFGAGSNAPPHRTAVATLHPQLPGWSGGSSRARYDAIGRSRAVDIDVLGALRVGDGDSRPSPSGRIDCGPIGDLAMAAGDVEHVGRHGEPREPRAQEPHQLLAPRDRNPPVRRAGREVAVVQVIGFDPRLDEGAHQRFERRRRRR